MTEASPVLLAPRPTHVPAELVVDFDFYNLPDTAADVQLAYRAFQQSQPDIFWTPRNGGHWVATRAEDIEAMQRDFSRFSHRHITIPKPNPGDPPTIPLELNPPEHGPYRTPLVRALLPKVVNNMEAKIRDVTISLIEAFAPDGTCEFIEQFAKMLPVFVFLDMVNLPREDRDILLPLAEQSVRGGSNETRTAAYMGVASYLEKTIIARREAPGSDLLSQIVNAEIDGQKIPMDKAVPFAVLVMFGGLDTVASMLGFVTRFLAMNPEHRREMAANFREEAFMRSAIEELLRRHGIANTAREIAYDFEYKGISFKTGEMILPPNMLVGLDDRKVSDPLTVDFRRPIPNPHAAFGNGPHTCPGATLARRELRVFLEEWFARIPEFGVKPGTKPVMATGMVNGVLELHLEWEAQR